MRLLRVLPLLLTVAVIWVLNHAFSAAVPAFGRLIDPVNGALANAEAVDEDFNRNLHLAGLQSGVSVWMDTSLIPHIRAGNDHDLYYVQGYIHAYFRLWQMDLQTRAAWGRISEIAGPKAIEFDRGMRREGMVWGAQHSLDAMEKEPRTKLMLDAYRDGVNAYIHSLNYRRLPLEYKLMGFEPEDWSNMRTALLLKYMARDLTGKTDDIAYTILRDKLGQEQFDFLFPERIKGSKPVIPEGTKFEAASLKQPAVPVADPWAHFVHETSGVRRERSLRENRSFQDDKVAASSRESESGIGSNNWAIAGQHTASGKPILCNDPHLGLNLPSLWYEMQLTAPGVNVYGASLPGAPGIVIGFNERISWGLTNNYRDVKDFYEITPAGKDAYLFCGKAVPYQKNVEVIKVRGGADVIDTVLYTVHGPVTYDATFQVAMGDAPPPGASLLACTWMAHKGTNELLSVYLLNRAADYNAFTDAISHFECPAQNFAYADGANNIAMWGQGRFINKWKRQGMYVMEGRDSTTLWGDTIPMAENPHVLNPPQGYVVSANQQVADSTYPYWYNGSFTEWRSWQLNEMLTYLNEVEDKKHSPDNEIPLQNDVTSALWKQVLLFDQHGSGTDVPKPANSELYPPYLIAESKEATEFQVWWSRLYQNIWQDEFPDAAIKYPSSERTVKLLLGDYKSKYYDDKRTQQVEGLDDMIERAAKETADSLHKLAQNASKTQHINDSTATQWYKVKNTTITHLAKIPAFSYDYLKTGGWSNTINACTNDHGPSWRMIVEMDSIPRAYIIYPGGQSGNPGSLHYGDFIQQWVEGKYHTVQFITAATTKNPLKYTWTLTKD